MKESEIYMMAQDLNQYSQELFINPSKAPIIKPIVPKKKIVQKTQIRPMTASEK